MFDFNYTNKIVINHLTKENHYSTQLLKSFDKWQIMIIWEKVIQNLYKYYESTLKGHYYNYL